VLSCAFLSLSNTVLYEMLARVLQGLAKDYVSILYCTAASENDKSLITLIPECHYDKDYGWVCVCCSDGCNLHGRYVFSYIKDLWHFTFPYIIFLVSFSMYIVNDVEATKSSSQVFIKI
jgi:hypothetical protein